MELFLTKVELLSSVLKVGVGDDCGFDDIFGLRSDFGEEIHI